MEVHQVSIMTSSSIACRRIESSHSYCNDPDRPPEMGSMVARLLDCERQEFSHNQGGRCGHQLVSNRCIAD